jgi:hypothetical protein
MLRIPAGQTGGRERATLIARWLLMIGVPLVLVAVEWQHPAGANANVYVTLKPMAQEWLNIHLVQLPLFGLMFVAALNLTWGLKGKWPWVSRVALWFFVVFYTALDAIAGLAVGTILVHQTAQMNTATVAAVVQQLFNDPIVGGDSSVVSLIGSWAWLIAILWAVLALYWENRQRPTWQVVVPSLLLIGSGYALFTGHARPYGPIAFALFALASLWFEIFHFGPASPTLESKGG